MKRRSALPLVSATLLLVVGGCGTANRDTADGRDTLALVPESASGSLANPAVAPAPLSFSALAGRRQMRAVPTTGDTTPTTYVLTATADSSGWSIAFPDRPPVPLRILAVAGDSIVAEAGPYRSVRRRGQTVTTRNVMRLEGDQLVGTVVARYRTSGADSVLHLTTEGTRQP